MTELPYKRKFVSIEPILDFDMDIFAKIIREISPELVAIGYDNYRNNLPEPPLYKTLQFVEQLSGLTKVRKRVLRQAFTAQDQYMPCKMEVSI